MSDASDVQSRSWPASALAVLGYAAVVVTAIALVGPSVGRMVAGIAYLLLGAASWLRSKSALSSAVDESAVPPDDFLAPPESRSPASDS